MNATAPQITTEPTTPPSATILDFPTNGDPASSPTRKGKIARLPFEIREQVNELLRGGRTYSQLVAELETLGCPGVTARNISNWKHGGYVDWLREQQETEARLALPKALERCVRSGEIDRIQQNAMVLAADHLMTIMGLFNPK